MQNELECMEKQLDRCETVYYRGRIDNLVAERDSVLKANKVNTRIIAEDSVV